MSANLDFSTQLYGFYKPIPAIFGKKVDMIRHVFTPTVGFSWSPNFGQFQPTFGNSRANNEWQYFGSYYRQTSTGELVPVDYSLIITVTFAVPPRCSGP